MTRIYPKKLVVKCPNWLGDVMMALPTIKAVKRDNSECHIILYLHKKFEPFKEFMPWVDEFIFHDDVRSIFQWKTWIKVMRDSKADTTLICVNSFKSALLMTLSKIPNRLGFNDHRSFFMTHGTEMTDELKNKHRRYWYESIASPILDGVATIEPALELTHSSHLTQLDGVEDPFIVLATGAAYGPAKEYGLEQYQELISLLQNKGYTCVLIGAPSELERASDIAKSSDKTINLVGKTTVAEMFLILTKAFAFIGNDSGPMHVSAMLGKPTLGIFGSTHPNWTGPVGPKVSYVYLKVTCSPCYKRHCPYKDDKKMKCMTDISPSMLINEFDKLIEKNN